MKNPGPSPDEQVIQDTLARLRDTDRVLIGAGAGMSIDAGIDYSNREHFARRFPAMLQYGYSCQWETLGFNAPDPALTWGFLADHVYSVRWAPPPGRVYQELLALVKEKEYFVITSNVDAQFAKSGFDEERIYTPQGSYALYQCLKPCTDQTWPSKPMIDAILPTIDRQTQRITDPSLIPACPNCGGPVFMNVRGGPWFIEKPYESQRARFGDFVAGSTDGSLLLLELGSGFNTPGVIRWPFENITRRHRDAHLVRVNPGHPEVPPAILRRSSSIPLGAQAFLEALEDGTRRHL